MRIFVRNLSLILHPCDWVAQMVVSEMKERLSPKKAPPMIIAATKGTLSSNCCAMPTAIGIIATIVPTLVPIESDITVAPRKSPARIADDGTMARVRFTISAILPISFALLAKAPARIKIHIISSKVSRPAPRANTLRRWFRFPRDKMIAITEARRNIVIIVK